MDKIIGPWRMKTADRIFHNHRLDFTAFRHLRRLPDRTLVYAEEYEERLRQYEARRLSASAESSSEPKSTL